MSAESGKPKRGTTVKHAPGPGYSKVRYVTGETFPIYIVNLHGHHIRADGEKLVLGQPTTFTTLSEPSDVQGGASLGTWSFEGAKDGFDVIRSYDGDAPIAKVQLLNERDLTANTVTVYFLNPGDKTVTILDGDEVIGTAKVTVVRPTLVEASARISRVMSVRTMYGARLGLGEETGSPPGLRITYTVKTDDAGAISGVALLSRETRIDQFGAPSLRSKRGVGMWRTLKDLHVTPGSNTTLSTAAYEADDGPSTLPFVSPGYELHDAPPWEAITVADAHAVYLRWKPWGPGSIWVTLASLLFRFKGAARRGDSGAVWAPKVENPEIVGPSIFRTGKLPEWEYSVPSTQDADLRANWEVSQ